MGLALGQGWYKYRMAYGCQYSRMEPLVGIMSNLLLLASYSMLYCFSGVVQHQVTTVLSRSPLVSYETSHHSIM